MSRLAAGGSLLRLAVSEPKRLSMPSASKRAAFRRSVRPEDAPVSSARPSAGPPNSTRGRMSSYSRCSGQPHRSAICSQSAVGSTRRLSGLLVMLPPHPAPVFAAGGEGCHKPASAASLSPAMRPRHYGEVCNGVLGNCATLPSQVGYSNVCYVGLGSSSPLRPTGGGERVVRDVAEETPPRYCSVCRHELKPEDYLYCPKCGTPLILAAQVPTPEADRPVPVPPQPGAGATGEPAQEQAAQEQPAQRGWWRRHPILTGGVGVIVVLFVFISVVGSLGGGGGGEESAKGGADQ